MKLSENQKAWLKAIGTTLLYVSCGFISALVARYIV